MTTFKGHITGFKPGVSNDVTPMPEGCKTKWSGRPVVPKGPLKVPGGIADIGGSNRRSAKAKVGDGGGGSSIRGTNAFTRKAK